MALTTTGLFIKVFQPQSVLVRHRSKINITRPRPLHFERDVVENLCKPYFLIKKKPKHLPDYSRCVPEKIEEKLHPLEIILSKEASNWIKNSKLIAFFHENAISAMDKFQNKLLAKKNGMRYLSYKNSIMKNIFENSNNKKAAVLIKSKTSYIVSENSEIHKLLSFAKKAQKMVLMAAIVEGRLLNLKDLQYYGEFHNIEQARLQLLATINASSQNLLQQVSHHSNNLVQLLNILQKHKKTKNDQ